MTISAQDYWADPKAVRKKEPQYVAFINKNSCTSCNSCASMCPVDCIYEVPGAPAQSYHQIDMSRCIGCQMCYRVPSESTGPWQMEICPWNAIDLIHNPNVKEFELILAPYAQTDEDLNLRKLEELGYQLYLNRQIYVRKESVTAKDIEPFTRPLWGYGDGDPNFAVLEPGESFGEFDLLNCTPEGDILVDYLFQNYGNMFLD